MLELTEEQQRDLAREGWPPRIRNPRSQETFVLIHAEMFERVRAILEEQDEIAAVEEMAPLVNEVLEADGPADRESA